MHVPSSPLGKSASRKLETFSCTDSLIIGKLLGTGKFNDVYEAHQISLTSSDNSDPVEDRNSRYVIKHLKESLAEEDSEAFRVGAIDLALEAAILSTLDHENIIKFHGVIPPAPASSASGVIDSTRMIRSESCIDLVLEKLRCTLGERIAEWSAVERPYCWGALLPLKSPSACRSKRRELLIGRLRAACDIAQGLQHLHSRNIMHRDLKPDNIGFDASGTAKIFDFGLAKKISPTEEQKRPTGLVGTVRYMAPEVAKCRKYDLSADLYSYGLILWEICALKRPFGELTHRDLQERVIYGDERPSLSSLWSMSLQHLMQCCWLSDAKERPVCELVVAILKQEMRRGAYDDMPLRRARPRFGRRSSMPMRTQCSEEDDSIQDGTSQMQDRESNEGMCTRGREPKMNDRRGSFSRRASMKLAKAFSTRL